MTVDQIREMPDSAGMARLRRLVLPGYPTWNNHVAIQMAQDPRNLGKATADLANAALAQGCLKVNR